MPEIPKIQIAGSVERSEELRRGVERFLERMKRDVEEEIIQISRNERLLIGEGMAARVFKFELPGHPSPCRICIKIWRDKPKRESTPAEYRKIQFLSPDEEFDLQDDLFKKNCKVARPVAFGHVEDRLNGRDIVRDVMAMEEISGYNLQEIIDGEAKIAEPKWSELLSIMTRIKKQRVVHRDLKPSNIMLKTDQELEAGAELRGEIFVIDFGVSRRVAGSSPDDDDFIEKAPNGSTIHFPRDVDYINALDPKQRGKQSPFLFH
ncbi:hypothetical protein C4571_00185 [Candidatus Parcubacteria bacterium]|nr:MAG: hypothetical protein C4571_00185 [Candidatus Parcubacteria bacterium]